MIWPWKRFRPDEPKGEKSADAMGPLRDGRPLPPFAPNYGRYDKTPYTPGMREVIKLSKAEAGRLGHDFIGPEHYLLGIIRKGDGLAIQTLYNLEVDPEDLKIQLERVLTFNKGPNVNLFSPNNEARKVLETTKGIARDLKHAWIGTEHLLLGLVKSEETIPGQCLAAFGIDFDKALAEVKNVIDGANSLKNDEDDAMIKALLELAGPCGICGSKNLSIKPEVKVKCDDCGATASRVWQWTEKQDLP